MDNISKNILVKFGLIFGFGFPLIVGFILPGIFGHPNKLWTLFIGMPLIIIALLKPYLLIYPYKSWIFFGNVMGWINSRLILGMIYLIVLQPIALIMKIIGYDPLKLKKINVLTYRENIKNKKIDLKKIF